MTNATQKFYPLGLSGTALAAGAKLPKSFALADLKLVYKPPLWGG